jgi:hypothetical protein
MMKRFVPFNGFEVLARVLIVRIDHARLVKRPTRLADQTYNSKKELTIETH